MHRIATKKELKHVLVFSGCYMSVAGVITYLGKNHEFLLYLMVMMVIIAAVIGVYKRAGASRGLLWGFSIWGIFHLVGGLTPIPAHWHDPDTSGVVYNWRVIPGSVKYDQIVHGFGVGLVTWLCWQALAVRIRSFDGSRLKPTPGMLSICATAGMGFGALNEVIEFFAVMLLPKTNVGDYVNTGWDLVSNLAGAITTAVIIRLVWWSNRLKKSEKTQADLP